MNLTYSISTFIYFSLLITTSYSQLDSIHWMPPLHSRDNNQVEDHYVYLSSPDTVPFLVTVANVSGQQIVGSPFTLSNSLPVKIIISSTQVPVTELIVPIDSLNKVLKSSGLTFTASKKFYANFRVRSQIQAGSLTSKGSIAKGTVFRSGSMPQLADQIYRNFVTGIMATEDNTTIQISDYDTNVVFDGIPIVTLNTLNINLDKHECYVVSGYTNTVANQQGFVGALIVSDKPIIVSTGNMCGSISSNSSLQDIGIDQIVPLNQVGTQYILIKGDGTPDQERPLVIAHYDSTIIFVNGNATAIDTINAGDWHLVDNAYYTGIGHKNMYVSTSKPVYMFQPLAGAFNDATPGMNFIPPFSCAMTKEVDLIPAIDSIGISAYSGAIIALTETGSVLTVNGMLQSGAETITGLAGWETYKITGFNSNVKVISTGAMATGMFGYSGQAGYAGYYSGFGSIPTTSITVTNLNPGNIVMCLEDTMLFSAISQGGVENYFWTLGDGTSSTDSSFLHSYDTTGIYNYTLIIEYECLWDTITGSIEVFPFPDFSLGDDIDLCVKSEVTIGVDPEIGLNYLWSTGETNSFITLFESNDLWLTVSNGICQYTDSISVLIPEDFIIPNVITPNGDNINDVFKISGLNKCDPFELSVYNRWGLLMFQTNDPGTNFWDGKNNGTNYVSPSTYYYILKSQKEEYKGTINVIYLAD